MPNLKNSVGQKRRLEGEHNQCPGCGEYFNSNKAFDKHRIGDFGVDRRCVTVEEMLAKGMSLSKTNWWITEAMVDSDFRPAATRRL